MSAVASQMDLHARFGGIVPEVASRRHLEACLPLVESTLAEAKLGWDGIEAVAVTQGPGLIGCLLIGVETAKALAWRHEKPLYAVHHLEAHLEAPFLRLERPDAAHTMIERGREFSVLAQGTGGDEDGGAGPRIAQPEFPHVGLIISGGHTSLVHVRAPGRCEVLAQTRDDAVGEAYDKVARAMGLGYPGGPVVDRLAAEGDPKRFKFTAPMMRRDKPDFSFSGLKSALAREIERQRGGNGAEGELEEGVVRDLCAGFQATVIEVLLAKSLAAVRRQGVRDLLIVGGVASNRGLRRAALKVKGPRIWFPHPSLCTDNAAMIAGLARHLKPLTREAMLGLNPEASLKFGAACGSRG